MPAANSVNMPENMMLSHFLFIIKRAAFCFFHDIYKSRKPPVTHRGSTQYEKLISRVFPKNIAEKTLKLLP